MRSSLLEDEHVGGVVQASGIHGLTDLAAAPLSEYLNANYNMVVDGPPVGMFAGCHVLHPRAWAALAHLVRRAGGGGRSGYSPPRGPMPPLPDDSEINETKVNDTGLVVMSGIDTRFDSQMLAVLEQVVAGELEVLFVSHLSRLSRNLEKLLRIMEIVLAHGSQVLTIDFLIRDGETWVRREPMVAARSHQPTAGLSDLRRLAGNHRRTAEELLTRIAESPSMPATR